MNAAPIISIFVFIVAVLLLGKIIKVLFSRSGDVREPRIGFLGWVIIVLIAASGFSLAERAIRRGDPPRQAGARWGGWTEAWRESIGGGRHATLDQMSRERSRQAGGARVAVDGGVARGEADERSGDLARQVTENRKRIEARQQDIHDLTAERERVAGEITKAREQVAAVEAEARAYVRDHSLSPESAAADRGARTLRDRLDLRKDRVELLERAAADVDARLKAARQALEDEKLAGERLALERERERFAPGAATDAAAPFAGGEAGRTLRERERAREWEKAIQQGARPAKGK
ncbi:MAG: hypothetical protein HY719_04475 [Planctomycetes bacterium]|nr:hypothetical protein [Planctomycetota bacterium]